MTGTVGGGLKARALDAATNYNWPMGCSSIAKPEDERTYYRDVAASG